MEDVAMAPKTGRKAKNHDWTRRAAPTDTDFQRFTRDRVDWDASPLGSILAWPAQLRQMVQLAIVDPRPTCILWGLLDDAVIIYNEAYAPLLGDKHPSMQGQLFRECWAEAWPAISRLVGEQLDTGQPIAAQQQLRKVVRNGYLEETYMSTNLLPILSVDDGSHVGYYGTVLDHTAAVLEKRRSAAVQRLGRQVSETVSMKTFWQGIITGLADSEYDLPLVMVYSVQLDNVAHSPSTFPAARASLCVLEAVLGITPGHKAAPARFDPSTNTNPLASVFRLAEKEQGPLLVTQSDGTLPTGVFEDVKWRGHGVECTSVVLYAFRAGLDQSPIGFMLLGLNPLRPYDAAAQEFIRLLTEQVATPHVSKLLLQEEVLAATRAMKESALVRISLSEELAKKTAEFAKSEPLFVRFADRLSIGVGIASENGDVLYGNSAWRRFVGLPDGSTEPFDFMKAVIPVDQEKVWKLWEDLVAGRLVHSLLRLKEPWTDPAGEQHPMWALVTAFTEADSEGSKIIVSSLADVSELKWAESQLQHRMDEAIELKKQQERFIDMISHEIRNPLSAMVHCIDEIVGNCKTESSEFAANTLELAQTVEWCAKHIRNIVGDVLTLSKLDSSLVEIVPVPVKLKDILQNTLRVFRGAARTADIDFQCYEDHSIADLSIDWLLLDPSRLHQVLVNLVNNAIKFTEGRLERTVSVRFSAHRSPPSDCPGDIVYVPPKTRRPRTIETGAKGPHSIYLSIEVQDTGVGLGEDERKVLFSRFRQASPKTESQYGGSGLGLFISRDLVELQSGRIGVATQLGQGSRFVFFIEGQPTTAPTQAAQDILSHSGPEDRRDTLHSTPIHHDVPHANNHDEERNSSLPSGAPRTVLVVEDNLLNQKILARHLRKRGYEVSTANHGEEALQSILATSANSKIALSGQSSHSFQVCLMDVHMPVMDGLTCMARIREMEKQGDLRGRLAIIAVTANVRGELVQSAIDAGADAITTKPYQVDELTAKMTKVWSDRGS